MPYVLTKDQKDYIELVFNNNSIPHIFLRKLSEMIIIELKRNDISTDDIESIIREIRNTSILSAIQVGFNSFIEEDSKIIELINERQAIIYTLDEKLEEYQKRLEIFIVNKNNSQNKFSTSIRPLIEDLFNKQKTSDNRQYNDINNDLNPKKNIPLALLLMTTIILIVYIITTSYMNNNNYKSLISIKNRKIKVGKDNKNNDKLINSNQKEVNKKSNKKNKISNKKNKISNKKNETLEEDNEEKNKNKLKSLLLNKKNNEILDKYNNDYKL